MLGISKRALFFQKYLNAAKKAFKGIPMAKDLKADTEIAGSLRNAVSAGIQVILRGLHDDLTTIVAGDSDDLDTTVMESFDLARTAIFELLKVRNVKAGKAPWLHYVLKGEEVPGEEKQTGDFVWIKDSLGPQSEPEAEGETKTVDQIPVWLRNEGGGK